MQINDFCTWLHTSPARPTGVSRIERIRSDNSAIAVVYFWVERLEWLDFREWLFDAECGFVGRDDDSKRRKDLDVVHLRNPQYTPRMKSQRVKLHFPVETNFYAEPYSSEPEEVTVESLRRVELAICKALTEQVLNSLEKAPLVLKLFRVREQLREKEQYG